jgi:autotransporter-associated beta strand protein
MRVQFKAVLLLATLILLASFVIHLPRPAQHPATAATPPTTGASTPAPRLDAPTTAATAPEPVATPTPGATAHSPAAEPATDPAAAAAPDRKRAWDARYLASLSRVARGDAIRFELVAGEFAGGTVRHTEFRGGELVHLAGALTTPEPGRFFFQKQSEPGKAGEFAGVVEFPASGRAYRIEPSGLGGASELVERTMGDVVCLALPPRPDADAEEIPPLDPSDHPDYPIPDYQEGIIPLQSLPGATGVLYIDYRGGYTPTWGGITYERPNVSNAQIRDVWKRVAEDYMPFRINVTTDIKVYEAAPENSRQRVVCTPTTTAAPGAGGVAYLNSWNWTGDTPCWSFYSSGKAAAEVVSHEAGHTLTLGHDGRTTPSEGYYGGQGSGAVGWAPIMGVGYYQPVAQWCKGEYTSANNSEDDLAKISGNNNNVPYRTDDTGVTLASARYLELSSGNTAFAEGVVERTGDADAFRFSTTGGLVSLRADPAPGEWADLAIQATLHDAAGNLIASNNPQSQLWASISTTVTNGSYTFRVTGVGRNNPLTDGFSNYASLGYYSVSGTVAGARLPNRFTVAENSPAGTAVGTVPATNPGGNPLTYTIAAGNTSGAFAINNSGLLSVANSAVLNYEALAAVTQFTVQYELFVNIVNTVNPALTETNRRVVVQILDVNEPPTLTGFTNTILAATRPGAVVGTVVGNDPEFYTILNYSIVSGNSNNLFAIGTQSGVVTVAGAISNGLAGVYNLTVRAADTGANPTSAVTNVRITIVPNNTPFAPGSLSYAVYDGIGGGVLVSDLAGNSRFPTDPSAEKQMTRLEGDTDRADNFGAVMRGYLMPPVSGSYTFWIASDDSSELRLSTTTNPASATVIASINNAWTSPREWTKYASQMSGARTLIAGQAYYLEARMKEGGGGDNLAVAWRGPATSARTNVIEGTYLAPYFINYLPKSTGFAANVRRDAFTGAALGQVSVNDVNSNSVPTFAIISGNGEGIFNVDAAGWVRVANEAALQATATTSFNLTLRVTDNGAPPLSTTCTATLTVLEASAIGVSQIQREMFYNLGSGNNVSDLLANAKYPGKPDALIPMTNFETPADIAETYGSRVRAMLVAPVSGSYRFFIASDDSSQLKISTTTNPASASVVASVSGSTAQNNWTTFASQTGVRSLVAGQRYYFEALQKEGVGGDHLSAAWVIPGTGTTNIIEAAYLEPVDINIAPTISNQSFKVFPVAPNGTVIGTLTAADGPLDKLCFKLVAGNTNGIFALDPASGALSVADNTLLADGTVTSAVLTVAAQDSGLGGLYPLRSSQATVTISLASTNDPFVWSGGGPDNKWSTLANWSGLAPLDGVRLLFGAPLRQANLNDFANFTARWLQFNTGGFSLGGNPLALLQGLTNAGNNTVALPLTLAAAQTWYNASGTLAVTGPLNNGGFSLNLVVNSDLRLDGPISGTGSLIKNGSARLIMQGAHTYTGVTTVFAASGTTTSLEISGAADLDLSGSTLVMNGRFDLWNHNATVGALSGTGLIFANDGNRTLTVGANNASGTFSGLLTNSTWGSGVTLGLIKAGLGTQMLSGVNAHSGGTTVRAGRISFNNGSALGTGLVTLGDSGTDTNGVTLLATAAVTANNPILISSNGSGKVTLGTDSFSAGSVNMQYGGTVTLERDVTLQAGSDDRTTFANRITGNGNVTVASPIVGARRVVLSRPSGVANDFVGDLTVSTNAWLQLGVSDNLGNRLVPDATVVKFWPGSRLRLGPAGSGDGETVGALQSLWPSAGIVEMFTGTAFTLTIGGGDAGGFLSGPVVNTSGTLSLTKIGAGTQVFAGGNNFSGPLTLQGGTLVAASSSALGSSAQGTVVNSAATLALSNNVTIAAEVIQLNGFGLGGGGALRNDAGTNAVNGAVTLASPAMIRAAAGSLWLGSALNAASFMPTFITEAGGTVTLANGLNNAAGLYKGGPGTLAVNAACQISGSTVISAGTLQLGANGSLNLTPHITLSDGAILDAAARTGGFVLAAAQTLTGNGTVAGAALINGTLRPGSSIGTLTFNDAVTLAGTTVMEIGKTGSNLESDRLVCGNLLAFGGTLIVTNLGPDELVRGDSFKLFSASVQAEGSFGTLVLPPLEGDLLWDASTLATDGTLRVAAPEPPTPPTLVVLSSSSSLTLSWPLDYWSYVLQGQTNTTASGVTSNWHPVPGVVSNTFTIPLDPAASSMFFRLVKP